MILGQQEAHKLTALMANVDAYESFQTLLTILHKQFYNELVNENSPTARGALLLIDELKELRQRVKDSIKNG